MYVPARSGVLNLCPLPRPLSRKRARGVDWRPCLAFALFLSTFLFIKERRNFPLTFRKIKNTPFTRLRERKKARLLHRTHRKTRTLPSPACGRGAGGEGGAAKSQGLTATHPPRLGFALGRSRPGHHLRRVGFAGGLRLLASERRHPRVRRQSVRPWRR